MRKLLKSYRNIIIVYLVYLPLSLLTYVMNKMVRLAHFYQYEDFFENFATALLYTTLLISLWIIAYAISEIFARKVNKGAIILLVVVLLTTGLIDYLNYANTAVSSATLTTVTIMNKNEEINAVQVRDNNNQVITLYCTNAEMSLLQEGAIIGSISYRFINGNHDEGYINNIFLLERPCSSSPGYN